MVKQTEEIALFPCFATQSPQPFELDFPIFELVLDVSLVEIPFINSFNSGRKQKKKKFHSTQVVAKNNQILNIEQG